MRTHTGLDVQPGRARRFGRVVYDACVLGAKLPGGESIRKRRRQMERLVQHEPQTRCRTDGPIPGLHPHRKRHKRRASVREGGGIRQLAMDRNPQVDPPLTVRAWDSLPVTGPADPQPPDPFGVEFPTNAAWAGTADVDPV